MHPRRCWDATKSPQAPSASFHRAGICEVLSSRQRKSARALENYVPGAVALSAARPQSCANLGTSSKGTVEQSSTCNTQLTTRGERKQRVLTSY